MNSSTEFVANADHASAFAAGDLRTGTWTRLGEGDVRGDKVTETILGDLAARARSAGQAQGYAQGWAQGMQEAAIAAAEDAARVAEQNEQIRQRLEADQQVARDILSTAARTVRDATSECLDEVNTAAVKVAFELVELILGRELALAADPGADAIARVLQLAEGQKILSLRMAPSDAGLTDTSALTAAGVEVIADPSISSGDAIADTGTGLLDATARAAIDRLREAWS